jgi:hypothetical protein
MPIQHRGASDEAERIVGGTAYNTGGKCTVLWRYYTAVIQEGIHNCYTGGHTQLLYTTVIRIISYLVAPKSIAAEHLGKERIAVMNQCTYSTAEISQCTYHIYSTAEINQYTCASRG